MLFGAQEPSPLELLIVTTCCSWCAPLLLLGSTAGPGCSFCEGAGRAGRIAQDVKCCPPRALNGSLGAWFWAGKGERTGKARVGSCWPLSQVSWTIQTSLTWFIPVEEKRGGFLFLKVKGRKKILSLQKQIRSLRSRLKSRLVYYVN